MNFIEKAEKLLILFTSLRKIMYNDGEKNWIRGIENIIALLTPPDYGGIENAEIAIKEVDYTYSSMLRGNGSFSDYFIWRDDFDERVKANEEFDRIKNEIGDMLY
ncbi:hypothetical protein BB987_14870 [Photorhabdus temperata]|uniref:Uncharacterized protein n=2 Tax=Photorhabdus khanii TaxID=1004150 RepID=W3VCJ2_9GAMM|nr:hypothetical protein [Photorhabdus khanii]ETS33646.1 hypothetical protein PTE_00822 [Photorhabdus khanii NC19]MQL46517.1 hypothetical protein [Photorhabdus khanii]OHV52230.1 hypothetical protein BB987_14870 [Photorhabdus temperata]